MNFISGPDGGDACRASLLRAGAEGGAAKSTGLREWVSGVEFFLAEACGFEDAFYFSRAFRQHHGYSPRDWRRSPEAL